MSATSRSLLRQRRMRIKPTTTRRRSPGAPARVSKLPGRARSRAEDTPAEAAHEGSRPNPRGAASRPGKPQETETKAKSPDPSATRITLDPPLAFGPDQPPQPLSTSETQQGRDVPSAIGVSTSRVRPGPQEQNPPAAVAKTSSSPEMSAAPIVSRPAPTSGPLGLNRPAPEPPTAIPSKDEDSRAITRSPVSAPPSLGPDQPPQPVSTRETQQGTNIPSAIGVPASRVASRPAGTKPAHCGSQDL